jgi:hypothetical protein
VAVLALTAGGGAVVGLLAAPVERASAACVLSVTYLGVPYISAGDIDAAETDAPAGPATIPACDDTPGAGPPEAPTPVTVTRVAGVAPRFGVALSGVFPSPQLLYADGPPCARTTTGATLACLRRRTARLITGPTLIARPSVRAGQVVGLSVHVRNARLRAKAVFGAGAVLQRRDGILWRTVYLLSYPLPGQTSPPDPVKAGTPGFAWRDVGLTGGKPRPVRLPLVDPGAYRIVKDVSFGARRTRVAAYLTIRPA